MQNGWILEKSCRKMKASKEKAKKKVQESNTKNGFAPKKRDMVKKNRGGYSL